MLQGRDGTIFLISATRRLIRYSHGLRGTAVVSFYANYEWFSSKEMSCRVFHQQSFSFGQPVPLYANITQNFPVHLHLPVSARVRRWEYGKPSGGHRTPPLGLATNGDMRRERPLKSALSLQLQVTFLQAWAKQT